MCFSQCFGKVVSEVSLQTSCKLFVFHDGIETACTLLVGTVDTKGGDLDAFSFQFDDIGFEDRDEYPVLVCRFFPFAVGNAEFSRIEFRGFWHDLVASVGTAFFVFDMIPARRRLDLDDLLYDQCKLLRGDPCLFCDMLVSSF